jgi:hypothetical protein
MVTSFEMLRKINFVKNIVTNCLTVDTAALISVMVNDAVFVHIKFNSKYIAGKNAVILVLYFEMFCF